MKIGVLYNVVDDAGDEAVSVNEILQTVGHVRKSLLDRHDVVPVRVRQKLFGKLDRSSFDIIINLCEGYGERAQGEFWIAGLLELMGIPYTGSGPLALGMSLNKMRTKQVLVANRIPTPNYQVFFASSQKLNPELVFPLIVKPIREDASVGISKESIVTNRLDLLKRIDHVISNYDQPALVEEYIDGRELNVSVIGNGSELMPLPVSEIVFDIPRGEPKIVDYESKWLEDSASYRATRGVCPADLTGETEARVKKTAMEVFRIMGLNDYARVDIRLKDGTPYVLEANPNPGINADSGFARSSRAAGMDYKAMVNRILDTALKRYSITPITSSGERVIIDDGVLLGIAPRYEHLNTIRDWFNDVEVSRYMDSPKTIVNMDDLVEDMLVADRGDVDLFIKEKSSGRPIGFGSLYSIDQESSTAELSCLVGGNGDRGRGYGKRMVSMLLGIAFERKMLRSVTATAAVENTASIKAMKGCGFAEVGVLKDHHVVDGNRHDEIVFQAVNPSSRI
ncbi:MAG: GNAT family N-acetyltransferase [Candidatus Thermoplasmatota archaeon]|nr:GNAT family N-acetyltransferase [Candidatus Thermoplasmatota archaeon]